MGQDKMNKTVWFPVSINPVRLGTYEYLTLSWLGLPKVFRAEWNGKEWRADGYALPTVRADQWRGLTALGLRAAEA
jgi:hypothetical protein